MVGCAVLQASLSICIVVAEPGTVFYSRKAVMQAELHRHGTKGVDWKKDPEIYADAVISGTCQYYMFSNVCSDLAGIPYCPTWGAGSESNKDMGGLLMQDGRDFLIYHTGQ